MPCHKGISNTKYPIPNTQLRSARRVGHLAFDICHLLFSAKRRGFTLIELLIVISLITMLAIMATFSYGKSQSLARDARRKDDLKKIQTALELYRQDNDAYPATSGFWYTSDPGNNGYWGVIVYPADGKYVPGLEPYLGDLPQDPTGGKSTIPTCITSNAYRAYLYNSNGADYKLLAWCSIEGRLNNLNDVFYDPSRPDHAWQISTPGATNW